MCSNVVATRGTEIPPPAFSRPRSSFAPIAKRPFVPRNRIWVCCKRPPPWPTRSQGSPWQLRVHYDAVEGEDKVRRQEAGGPSEVRLPLRILSPSHRKLPRFRVWSHPASGDSTSKSFHNLARQGYTPASPAMFAPPPRQSGPRARESPKKVQNATLDLARHSFSASQRRFTNVLKVVAIISTLLCAKESTSRGSTVS